MIKIIAFDAEFAIQEILELSVYSHSTDNPADIAGFIGMEPVESFHQYFKPRTERRWPFSQKIHKISPAMVAHRPYITRFKDEIERRLLEADYYVGFDIGNDVGALEYEGISGIDREKIIDVKDFHWLVYGREKGVPLDGRKGLEVTAEELGMEFEETKAHGASYDTFITIKCFLHLLELYSRKYPEETVVQLLERYRKEWETTSDEYHREYAKGYASLIPAKDGYRLKVSRNPVAHAEVSIPVNARWRAQDEIDAKFRNRISRDDSSIYCLKPSDIQWIKGYKNEYDSQETMHKKMFELRRKGGLF